MFVVIAAEGGRDCREDAQAMAEALRGTPDGVAVWSDAALGVALGVRAYGIQPEDVFDRQPYMNDQVCFASDGYVDDRAETARVLGIDSAQLATIADGELLFRAFQRFGAELPAKISGHYAFVAIDRASGEVLLSDDHVGSRQVFFAERGGTFIAASQLGAMLAHPQIERKPDLDALALLVAPKMLRGATPVMGVSLLLGGNMLRTRGGSPSVMTRWWHPEALPEIRYRRDDQYAEHALELVQASTVRAIGIEGGVASMLSGGLDSTLISAIAARQLAAAGRRLAALHGTIEEGVEGYYIPDWDHDETPLVDEMARLYPNIDVNILRPAGRCFLDIMEPLQRISHTAVRNTSNHLLFFNMLQRMDEQGQRVLLTGGFGNAVISLDGRSVLARLVDEGRWVKALRLAHGDGQQGGVPAWRSALHAWHDLRKARRGDDSPRPGAYMLRPSSRARLQEKLDERILPTLLSREGHVGFATRSSHSWVVDFRAHAGIEVRDPLASRRLIEASLRFPLEAHMSGSMQRGLARVMGKGLVPDSIRLRRSRGAQSPETPAIIRRHGERYSRALQSITRSSACVELFNLAQAGGILQRLLADKGSLSDAYNLERLIGVGSLIQDMGY